MDKGAVGLPWGGSDGHDINTCNTIFEIITFIRQSLGLRKKQHSLASVVFGVEQISDEFSQN